MTVGDDAGRGGPNQELAVQFATQIGRLDGVTLLSLGTDGTDGPTTVAGTIGGCGRHRVDRDERDGPSIIDCPLIESVKFSYYRPAMPAVVSTSVSLQREAVLRSRPKRRVALIPILLRASAGDSTENANRQMEMSSWSATPGEYRAIERIEDPPAIVAVIGEFE